VTARPDYSRMPGFGDLPGDASNPNSPDYVEPAFDESEAMWSAAQKIGWDDAAEILGDLADTATLLATLQKAPGLSATQYQRLEMLAHHARSLSAKREREYELLNGEPR
jgi:hypothetical protein